MKRRHKLNDHNLQTGKAQASGSPHRKKRTGRSLPRISIAFLILIICGCACCEFFSSKDPAYMDLTACHIAPGPEFWFGTDAMGRDIFSMIWYGGRVSLFTGFAATALSTTAAVLYGAISGLAPWWLDALLMRLTEILHSIPDLLLVTLLGAFFEKTDIVSLSVMIGMTGWYGMAKVIRTEVRRMRGRESILAARCMGGSFFYILFRHLLPEFLSPVLYMIVMNIRSAIIAESTLSFMGMGLPLEVISWGSMLSLSSQALTTGAWWIVCIPGFFLITTLICITDAGNCLQRRTEHRERIL